MQIIISPAKRMVENIAYMEAVSKPIYLKKSKVLQQYMKKKTTVELQSMLKCSKAIAQWSKQSYQEMNVNAKGVPAILAYDGIQYQYMKPDLFDNAQFSYVKEHLFILSGLYGILRSFDGVVPYRLEMDSIISDAEYRSLYEFWGDSLAKFLSEKDTKLLNLASLQYAKAVLPYCVQQMHIVTCYFYEEEHGQNREKGVYVKMARGEMVRYLAENNITDFEGVKHFQGLGYQFDEVLSTVESYVFVRKARKNGEK